MERIADKIDKEDLELLQKLIGTLVVLMRMLRVHKATASRLRRFLGLGGSEKTDGIVANKEESNPLEEDSGSTASATPPPPPAPPPPTEKKRAKGHGRISADKYANAEQIAQPHPTLAVGEHCPECPGKLYQLEPASILRIFGQPNLIAKNWNCERLRCGGCGHVYTAPGPAEAQGPKYDETAVSSIIHLRFGAGLPHNRLERLQDEQQTPVPASTQWELIEAAAPAFRRIVQLLEVKAAQGTVIHNDDTYVRILEYMGKTRAKLLKAGELETPERTGLFTTAVVSKTGEGPICLFYTGRKHAGENLAKLLVQRASDLEAPVLMSDASSRNLPDGHDVEEANCLAHGRRNFVDEFANYPEQCTHVLGELRRVFQIESECRSLSEDERFKRHRSESAIVMKELHDWMKKQVDEKTIEPNSGMGKAMNYMLKRWKKFTLFTRKAGVPLDNNIAERVLKRPILGRRNSLFYRNQHGADIGDIYTSIIHTAELHGANPWDYLTAVQRNASAVRLDPGRWLPWNYKAAVAAAAAQKSP